MKKTLDKICKECNGDCCSTVWLSEYDLQKLQGINHQYKVKKYKVGYQLIQDKLGNCPFLNVGTGCILEKEQRPLDCTLFPLAFTENSNKYTFYINKYCPYYKQVPKNWIVNNIDWAKKNLNKWTKEERKAYINRQKDQLQEI